MKKDFKIKSFKIKQGFTLVELLVAVAILAVLSTIGLATFSGTQRRGRDSRRRSDLKAIQNSFEQYYTEDSTYTDNCANMATSYLQGGLITAGPKGESYNSTCSSAGYCFCASLEESGGNATGSDCSFSSTGGDYFCITNLQ